MNDDNTALTVDSLIEMLQDDDQNVRIYAGFALATLGPEVIRAVASPAANTASLSITDFRRSVSCSGILYPQGRTKKTL